MMVTVIRTQDPDIEPLLDAGATSVCGTNADGYWCEVGDSNDAYLETDAPDAYGTELAVGIDRACLLTDNGLNLLGYRGRFGAEFE
jgi:hypothetical protein